MLANGLADAAKDDAFLAQFLLKSGFHRDRIHDGIHSCSTQSQTLFQRNAQLIERFFQLRINLFVFGFAGQRVCIIGYVLVIYLGKMQMSPRGLLLFLPILIGLQTEIQQPLRLILLLRNQANDVFVESFFYDFGLHIGGKAKRIFALCHLFNKTIFFCFCHVY